MTESKRHWAWKNAACGCGSETEYNFRRGSRLDCINPSTRVCGEVELSRGRIQYDLRKLQAARTLGLCKIPKLIVDPKDFDYAKRLARGKEIDVAPATSWNLTSARSCSIIDQRKRARLAI